MGTFQVKFSKLILSYNYINDHSKKSGYDVHGRKIRSPPPKKKIFHRTMGNFIFSRSKRHLLSAVMWIRIHLGPWILNQGYKINGKAEFNQQNHRKLYFKVSVQTRNSKDLFTYNRCLEINLVILLNWIRIRNRIRIQIIL